MFLVLLLVSILSSALGDPYSCQNDNFTLDATNPTYSIHSKQMDDKQNCVWNFVIPTNFMAEITVEVESILYLESIRIFSRWGPDNTQLIDVQGEGNTTVNRFLHVMWPPTFFEVDIATIENTSMILTINITLNPLSMADKPTTYLTTMVNKQPNYVQFMGWKKDTTITAQAQSNGKLVLTVDRPSWDQTTYPNIFVYDGSGADLQFLGTLQSLVVAAYDGYYTSTSETLTFYRAMDTGATATLVINDYENVNNVTYLKMDWSPYNRPNIDYQQAYLLDASKGLAALTVLNEADGSNAIYLQKVEYMTCSHCPNYTSPMKVLAGGMIRDYDSQGTLLGIYKDWEMFDARNCPQYLSGMARTFVLEAGQAVVYYTSVAAYAKDLEADNGRSGFVMSNNYPFMSQDQDSQDFVLKSVDGNVFIFEYTITEQNDNMDACLNFRVKDAAGMNNFTVDLHSITTSTTFNLTALEMTMTIFGGNQPSTGTSIPYKISSTANFSDRTTSSEPTLSALSSSISVTMTATNNPVETTTQSGTTIRTTTPKAAYQYSGLTLTASLLLLIR